MNPLTAPVTIVSQKFVCSINWIFCIPVALYTLLGFIQMSIWAKGKHRAYIREFKDYPSLRMAIIPLILWLWSKYELLYLIRGVCYSFKVFFTKQRCMLSSTMQVFYINEWTERSGNGSNNIMAIHWGLLKIAWNILIVSTPGFRFFIVVWFIIFFVGFFSMMNAFSTSKGFMWNKRNYKVPAETN